MKKQVINFKEIPSWWAICQNTECLMAKDCLRYQAFLNVPDETTRWPCILPNALKKDTCPFFRKAEVVRMAKGFHSLFNSFNSRDLRHDFRTQLTEYLGSKGSYYRYKDGERLLNPKQQQWILDFLNNYGYKDKLKFDQYIDTYEFR